MFGLERRVRALEASEARRRKEASDRLEMEIARSRFAAMVRDIPDLTAEQSVLLKERFEALIPYI